MDTTLRIGLDFDDTLIGFNQAFAAFHNKYYGTRVRFEDICHFLLETVYECTEKEIVERIHEFFESDYHDTIDALDGARDAVHFLSNHAEIHVITARSEAFRERTQKLADTHFPDLFAKMHFTGQFGGAKGVTPKTKLEICQELGIDVFVDDIPHHTTPIAAAGIHTLLLTTPWNQDKEHGDAIRVTNWNMAHEHIFTRFIQRRGL